MGERKMVFVSRVGDGMGRLLLPVAIPRRSMDDKIQQEDKMCVWNHFVFKNLANIKRVGAQLPELRTISISLAAAGL